jgi:hypothetical protein
MRPRIQPLAYIDASVMQRSERRSVTDRNDRGVGQSLAYQRVDHALGGLVERSCGLVKEQPIGFGEDGAYDG